MTSDDLSGLECQLQDLMSSGYVDRLVRRLEASFRVDYATVEDGVAEAVLRLARRWGRAQVDDVGAWLTVVVTNWLKHRVTHIGLDELPSEPADDALRPEDVAVAADMLRYVKDVIGRWENRNVATITQLYVEAAFAGEPLSLVEARDLAQQILGENISLGSVGTWKSRGFDRLERELDGAGFTN